MTMNHDDLVRRYSVDGDSLPLEIRAHQAALAQQRAENVDTDPDVPEDQDLLGLDDNMQPFPVRSEPEDSA